MKINSSTKPYQMAELMGRCATVTDGRDMIALCRFIGFTDTESIPENVWHEMLNNVCGTGFSDDELATMNKELKS